ncbi:MAG: RidA family protein [Actinomycetota bacterium]
MSSVANPAGGYRYVPGIPPYSAGVLADEDMVIVRTTLSSTIPWRAGFASIDEVLANANRPSQALCAVELRCAAPHSFDGFGSFNDDYRNELDARGILLAEGVNPVARTNVAPRHPTRLGGDEEHLFAFSFTVPRSAIGPTDTRPSFVIAGAGDLVDQADLRPESIVGGAADWAATGEQRAEAVLDEIEARLVALDLSWAATDVAVVYSVEHVGAVLQSTVLPRLGEGGNRGTTWIHAEPPITGLRFEMDARGGVIERRG